MNAPTTAAATENASPLVGEVPPEDFVWIDGLAMPPSPPVRPFHALRSVIKLVRNKEDTRQVFETVYALAGKSGHRLFTKFIRTDYGRKVVTAPVKLEEILSDREALRALPEGSLGRVYLAFMEGENLTADGLLDAAGEAGIDFRGETQFEEYRRMYLHTDVSHDLWHVLTGYGRDALGELCNLAFTRIQSRNPGFRLIIWIGLIAMKLERPGQPIWRAANEGRRMGEGVDFLLGHDVEALLVRPLDDVRRDLGFIEPAAYNSIPDDVKQNLLKPKVRDTQSEREARTASAAMQQ